MLLQFPAVKKTTAPSRPALSEIELRALEAQYCSYGDTVHYSANPKFFVNCEGSYLYDSAHTPFLDLQMWHSSVNFGYKNPRTDAAARRQLDTLPQVGSQYLHAEKIELAAHIAQHSEEKFGLKGRVHFNVGGSQAIEDAIKLVRNYAGGKSLMFAFEGGYHGRTLGATAITSSYRYRRKYGHFGDRAQFIEYPNYFRRTNRALSKEEHASECVQKFARLFETEYNGVWDPRAEKSEYAAIFVESVQGTGGGTLIPPKNFFKELKHVLDQHGILMVVDEIKMGMYRTGKMWAIEHFDVAPDVIVFGKSLTNGLNPLSGIWAKEDVINPALFPAGSTHSTFASNPMGTAVALEVMRMAEEENYEDMVAQKGRYFLEGLQDLQKRHKVIGDVDGLGLALRLELCQEDGFTPDKSLLEFLLAEGMKGDLVVGNQKYGLVLDTGGWHKNVIVFAPALTISYPEIDLSLQLLDQLFMRARNR